MTQREFYESIINANINDELTSFAADSIRKMDERAAKRAATPSKSQLANASLISEIITYVSELEDGATAALIAEHFEISTQRASALARKIALDGIFNVSEIKVKGKGKVKLYTAAG